VSPDQALQEFDKLNICLNQFVQNHYSETDTRIKFIDPLLKDVLGWDEYLHIKREEQYVKDEDRRCIDYLISLQEPILVVEAKKNLKQFEIPTTLDRIEYSLRGVIKDWENAWSAICQAQRYCSDQGARYALVTNGHQYIVFKAVSEQISWMKGHALVFGSPGILRQHLTLFYECLAKETIAQDKLSEIAFPTVAQLFRKKPRSSIKLANSGYRNDMYSVLDSAFRDVLLDVPQKTPGFLKECYCSSADAMRYSGQLNTALIDPLPIFRTPIEEVQPGHRKDVFNQTIAKDTGTLSGKPLFVVMGGDGVGKTSFLHWYFEEQLPPTVKSNSIVVFCDFRKIECNVDELHTRTLRMIIDQILSQSEASTGDFNQLYEMFRTPIEKELKGALKPFASNREERQKQIAALLIEYQDFSLEHLKAIIFYLKQKKNLSVIVVLDNMDQKDPSLQDKLFQIAHELVYGADLVAIISFREATYRRMVNTPNFNAFASKEFHVKAQPLDLILEKRLNYVGKQFNTQKVSLTYMQKTLDVVDFDRFIQLIRRSLLSDRADFQILECIASISNCSIREQLGMIYSFFISGQTKIDDYFWSYARNTDTFIPFHEVLYSLLLEDHKFFDEGIGHRFMNIFEPCPSVSLQDSDDRFLLVVCFQ